MDFNYYFMSSERNQRILQALRLTEDELLMSLGEELVPHTIGAFPKKEELIDKGKEWMNRLHDKVQCVVCSSTKVREAFEKNEDVLIAAAIADVIVGFCTGVSPVTVAALITKRCLLNFCSPIWDNKQSDRR